MKACRQCRYIVMNEKVCPICGSTDLTEQFSGMVIIVDVEKSEIAKEMGITVPGKYALRIHGKK